MILHLMFSLKEGCPMRCEAGSVGQGDRLAPGLSPVVAHPEVLVVMVSTNHQVSREKGL